MESDVSDEEVKTENTNENNGSDDSKNGNYEVNKTVKKKRKHGVVYLSTIPRYMNVIKLRDILSEYGEIGRVFLQPGKPTKKNKPAKYFTEGWVEFESKRTAKNVAAMLNNKMIGGRKKSKFYDQIWNMKYLPRFKWAHLSERLAYEHSVRKQRLQVEIHQAKKEANYFSHRVEQSDMLRRIQKQQSGDGMEMSNPMTKVDRSIADGRKPVQNPVMEKIKAKQKKAEKSREKFLANLFA